MPSAFLSALLVSLSVGGISAAPTSFTSTSSITNPSFRDTVSTTSVPKWAIDACNRIPRQCKVIDGLPTILQIRSPPKRNQSKAKAAETENVNTNTSQVSGIDGNRRNTMPSQFQMIEFPPVSVNQKPS